MVFLELFKYYRENRGSEWPAFFRYLFNLLVLWFVPRICKWIYGEPLSEEILLGNLDFLLIANVWYFEIVAANRKKQEEIKDHKRTEDTTEGLTEELLNNPD
ncbi:Oidioi.mRNA.OKI2018_I69.chr1.g1876.t1.cds [Oikopleura dioica]|uniref:Oidioi.mRNA.OKI2018_I69.chr1.g1876.t1.cds n=1 Tax=Oikopleura dioica TaxID=34765 RepID=A0ABN7SPB0_OIKDI|nr:Oidioi.mRNA.OKI2018_I69.chr1.g1876.t1.cds [Oikopleura dioica]